MRKEYKIGQESNKIYLDVNIGTPGIAHTKVFQYLSDDEYDLLTESDVDSGNIKNAYLGKGSGLIGSYIKIRTVVDFGSIDSSQWEQLNNSIVGRYGISGGFLGNQPYNYDENNKTDSSSFRIAIIDMEIDLIK